MSFPEQPGQDLLEVIGQGGALRQALGIFGASEGEDYWNEGAMARAGTGIAVGDGPEELAWLEVLGGGAEGFEEADDFGGQAPGEHGAQAGQLALEQGAEDGVQEEFERGPVVFLVIRGSDHGRFWDRGGRFFSMGECS